MLLQKSENVVKHNPYQTTQYIAFELFSYGAMRQAVGCCQGFRQLV
jgi:hypothetical protein